MNGPRHGLVDIAVVEDDVRALSTELKGDLLEVRVRRSLHDLATDEGAAGEGDLLEVHVVADVVTDRVSVSVDNVYNTGWETCFEYELGGEESREGSELRGLKDDAVAGGEGGAEFPGEHHHCWQKF